MEHMLSGRQILSFFFPHIRSQSGIQGLWNRCPNQMLWEAIRTSDATIVTWHEVLQLLHETPFVFAFPEPLPFLYLGAEPVYSIFPTEELLEGSPYPAGTSNSKKTNVLAIEPLYLICSDHSWMIALTTENTPSGGQLCALLPRQVGYGV